MHTNPFSDWTFDCMGRYLFVIPTLANGGAERVVSVLSGAISRNGHSVSVIKYYKCPEEYPIDTGVNVVNLSGGGREDYLKMSYWEKIRLLRYHLKHEAPTFVIPFLYTVSRAVSLATIGMNVNVLQTIRIDPASAPSSRLHRMIRDCLVSQSKCSFVQNEKQREYFHKCRDKVHVLFNPVSESLLGVRPSFENRLYTICAAGRLEKQKNFTLLIDSFCKAFSKDGEAVLKIYGDGSLKDYLTEYIFQLGRGDSIQLMGRTEHIEDAYKCSDLFVLSSDFEGMPNALIEAMACGLPSISTDCPTGPSDLIEDGKNGLLVPMKDVNAMSLAILSMHSDRDRAIEMGQNARETIRQKCNADAIAKKMIEICESIE